MWLAVTPVSRDAYFVVLYPVLFYMFQSRKILLKTGKHFDGDLSKVEYVKSREICFKRYVCTLSLHMSTADWSQTSAVFFSIIHYLIWSVTNLYSTFLIPTQDRLLCVGLMHGCLTKVGP